MFENSKFVSKKFGNSHFGISNFSNNVGSSSGDEDHNDAWLWEDSSYILWEDGLSLILLES